MNTSHLISFYIVIHVKPGIEILSEEDIYLGPKLKYKKEAQKYYKLKLSHLCEIEKSVMTKPKKKYLNISTYLKGL